MILGHIMGIPLEESVLLAPAGAATTTWIALAGRTRLARLVKWLRHS